MGEQSWKLPQMLLQDNVEYFVILTIHHSFMQTENTKTNKHIKPFHRLHIDVPVSAIMVVIIVYLWHDCATNKVLIASVDLNIIY